MKTSELIGPALDWAVAKCEGTIKPDLPWKTVEKWHYSTDWAQGGPLIEREGIVCEPFKGRRNDWRAFNFHTGDVYAGKTPLVAAMRCYVASKLGDEVELPEGLK